MKQNVFLVSLFELFNNTLFSRRFSVIEWIQYKKLKTQKQVCFLKKKKMFDFIYSFTGILFNVYKRKQIDNC